MKKILVIRFSSIGDIVLTTPIVRCLKKDGKQEHTVHYLTKKEYVPLLEANPYIDKIFSIDKSIDEVITQIRREHYDYVIDLHKNLRTFSLKVKLRTHFKTFDKCNFRKWLLVKFKINLMPDMHIVDRYFKTTKSLGIENDGAGLDYFISEEDNIDTNTLAEPYKNGYVCIAIGGKHATKQIPSEKLISICSSLEAPIILLGGKEDKTVGDNIVSNSEGIILNGCGLYNINQTASVISQSLGIITGDTGLMHIAAALKKKIVSVWGSTVPAFGMYPYLPKDQQSLYAIVENKDLRCRPCSKLGFTECPKKHFDCMKVDVVIS